MRIIITFVAAIVATASVTAFASQSMMSETSHHNASSSPCSAHYQKGDMNAHHAFMMSSSSQPMMPVTSQRPIYQGHGVIKAWDQHSVTIAHQAIPDLHWPAMTMSFALPATLKPSSLHKGEEVNFSFRVADTGNQLVDLASR